VSKKWKREAKRLRRIVEAKGAFPVTELPCPQCGEHNIVGLSLVLDGKHNHTKYVCRTWVPGGELAIKLIGHPPSLSELEDASNWGGPCGWAGWTVPGWDRRKA
jgi:hypothetical protein